MTSLAEQLRASLDRHEKLEGEWTCEAVGEKYHQEALADAVVLRHREIRTEVSVNAELIRERDNDHDPEAIRVEVDGRKIGHLPRTVPQYHRAALIVLLDKGVRLFADGRILGRAESERGPRYEVVLELPDTSTLIDLLRANE